MKNAFNQPIGLPLPQFSAGELPHIQQLIGQTVLVEKLDCHQHDLFPLYSQTPLQNWTYLPISPFENKEDFDEYALYLTRSADPYYLTILDKKSGQVLGTFSLMRIDRANRVIEVGWVLYSPELQRSRQATEAQFLLMKYVFDCLQYRRYEWKCDSLNMPSFKAAERLGFTFEGIFRNAAVYKGRSRDTAWFSIIDSEWGTLKNRFENWLDPSNFDEQGKQILRLSEL